MQPDYTEAAKRFIPSLIRVLIVAESPPAYSSERTKSYFYFEDNPGSDILFATVVEAFYAASYRKTAGNKLLYLQRLQSDGIWLVDAVEYPINRNAGRNCSSQEREQIIRANGPSFLARLKALQTSGILHPEAGIVIIKKSVFSVLSAALLSAGFRLLQTSKIDFPKYYRDRDTIAGIRKAVAQMGIMPNDCLRQTPNYAGTAVSEPLDSTVQSACDIGY